MSTPWYQFGITQQHGQNGELGVDVGTPFHTSITDIFSGTVLDAGFHPWGGQVDIQTTLPNGQTVIEQFLHLDTIAANIRAGAQVVAGQLLGLSGGETPMQAVSLPGAQHPAVAPFSTGPHTEFGLYTGTPSAATALDPTSFLQYGGTGVGSSGSNTAQPSTWGDIIAAVLGHTITTPPGQAVGSAIYNAPKNLLSALTPLGSDVQQGIATGGIILLAVVFIIFGLALLLWPSQQKIEQGTAAATKVAEVAAA